MDAHNCQFLSSLDVLIFQLFLKGPRGARCRELLNDISVLEKFHTETILSPLPTVVQSTNPISNASNGVEGEEDTPDSRFSMVTRAVDNWKRQTIPEPALSHWLPLPPPVLSFVAELTNCHTDARFPSLLCVSWQSD